MPTPRRRLKARRGIALVTVLLLMVLVATLAAAAAVMTTTTTLVARYADQQTMLETVADAGLELARSRVNGDKTLYPDSGYALLEDGVTTLHADSQQVGGVRRWTYIGPTGVTSGQYGVFGSVVVVAEDRAGNRVVRRGEIAQESFAKFAYFTDVEPSNISFGGGDQLFGPVHTNDDLKIYSSGASFFGSVTTAGVVQGAQYGTFAQGYTEQVQPIEMPDLAELDRLESQAAAGNMAFVGGTTGTGAQATTRIEFVAIDLNGDGNVTGADEGFIRIYQSNDPGWVTAHVPADYNVSNTGLRNSRNCGHYHGSTFVSADDHPATGGDNWMASVSNSSRRCYLGGSDSLWGDFVPDDGIGEWLPWSGSVHPALTGRPDAGYLHPIGRANNPSFKGVIFVEGRVAVSGTLRGQITLAATEDIVIADDVVYATNPASGTCADMLGLFAGGDIVMADNTINAPVRPRPNQANWFTYDDTKDEFVHAVVLTLGIFTVENYASGATRDERCETELWGRGCLYLTGGIIQRTRGAVATIQTPGGTGYLKRYSYDQCGATNPPPYFPTTGRFGRGRYYQVDPVGFDVDSLFSMLTPGS